MLYLKTMDNSDGIRTVPMNVINTDASAKTSRFVFDMQAQTDGARQVRFSIDQVDAKAMYEALGKFLNADD